MYTNWMGAVANPQTYGPMVGGMVNPATYSNAAQGFNPMTFMVAPMGMMAPAAAPAPAPAAAPAAK